MRTMALAIITVIIFMSCKQVHNPGEGTSASVGIQIKERANRDMQIFEGEVVFFRK